MSEISEISPTPSNYELTMRTSQAAHAEVADIYKRHYDALRARAQDCGHSVLSLWESETYKLEQAQADLALFRGYSEQVLPKALSEVDHGSIQYTQTDDMFTAKLIASRALFGSTSDYRANDGIYYPIGARNFAHGNTELFALHPVAAAGGPNLQDMFVYPKILSVYTKEYDLWQKYSNELMAREFTSEEILAMRPAGQKRYMVPQTYRYGIGIYMGDDKYSGLGFSRSKVENLVKKGMRIVHSTTLDVPTLVNVDIASFGIEEPMADLAAAFDKTDELQELLKARIAAFKKD